MLLQIQVKVDNDYAVGNKTRKIFKGEVVYMFTLFNFFLCVRGC